MNTGTNLDDSNTQNYVEPQSDNVSPQESKNSLFFERQLTKLRNDPALIKQDSYHKTTSKGNESAPRLTDDGISDVPLNQYLNVSDSLGNDINSQLINYLSQTSRQMH